MGGEEEEEVLRQLEEDIVGEGGVEAEREREDDRYNQTKINQYKIRFYTR